MAKSKVKSRSHLDVAHLHSQTLPHTHTHTPPPPPPIPPHPPPSNQCSYQISTSYTLQFPMNSPDKIFKLKITKRRPKVNQGHTITLHTYTPPTNIPTKYQHLKVSEIQPGRDNCSRRPFTYPPSRLAWVIIQNNTHSAFKGSGVKCQRSIKCSEKTPHKKNVHQKSTVDIKGEIKGAKLNTCPFQGILNKVTVECLCLLQLLLFYFCQNGICCNSTHASLFVITRYS